MLKNKTFAFRVSSEDRDLLDSLASQGADVALDIEPQGGGLSVSGWGAELIWSWVGEIDLVGPGKSAECKDPLQENPTFDDVEEAVEAALSAATVNYSNEVADLAVSFEVAVSDRSLALLNSLDRAGFDLHLALDPDTGGLAARHACGTSLRWWFITELHSTPDPAKEIDKSDVNEMLKFFFDRSVVMKTEHPLLRGMLAPAALHRD